MVSNNSLTTELIIRTERAVDLATFAHLHRHGLLPQGQARGTGIRSWIAGRLAGLALRLDRPAAQGVLSANV